MQNIKNNLLINGSTIKEAMRIIQESRYKIVLIIDENNKFMGTITDGDIRRALLNNLLLTDKVNQIMNHVPVTCTIDDSKAKILHIAKRKKYHYIPIIDDNNEVIGVHDIEELEETPTLTNEIILMVGGLGTRLQPLTNDTPKPLLKVGKKPILETIIESFANYGFINITLCVNYKAEQIKKYFKDGSNFGVKITYITENQRLGTAGALSLIKKDLKEPFFVMNGDLLTNINFEHFLNFHIQNDSIATMSIREIETQIPYGVIETKDHKILSIKEKPIQKIFVNAGIYVLEPKVLEYVPKNKFFDMPTLFEILIKENKNVLSYTNNGYWIDIGHLDDYKKANSIIGEDL